MVLPTASATGNKEKAVVAVVRIIKSKPAPPADEWWVGKNTKCYNCGTRCVVEADDRVQVAWSYPRKRYEGWMNCPTCNHIAGLLVFHYSHWWDRLRS